MNAILGFEDGDYVVGRGFGGKGSYAGELVFSTQMTGYMEALTDPSYHGQILLFTYPMIGNYGVDQGNFQSRRIWAGGCVVREICQTPAAHPALDAFFEERGYLGISGVDTRRLTIKMREGGTLRAALIVGEGSPEDAVALARTVPPISDRDLIPDVSCRAPYHLRGTGDRIAVLDLGIKKNMLISLQNRDADLIVFPHNATYRKIEDVEPRALLISNGPGDPKRAIDTIQTVRAFVGQIPVFGICMGNQIAALALGGDTYKMKFGHRGTNQPVRYHDGGIFITTQNHGYAVDPVTLPEGCRISHRNVNDGTVEGFQDPYLCISCVQFHPEAHGGPRDTEHHYFDHILKLIH